MANTYITTNSKFKPYTFDEMIKPALMYKQAYEELEGQLGELDTLSGSILGKLSNDDDSLKQTITNFNAELAETLNNLDTTNLNTSRKTLLGLQKRYKTEIDPINEAYKAYIEDQKYLERMAVEHPEILINGASKKVSDYMHGARPQMTSIHTDDLMNEAIALAQTQAARTYRESDWTSTAGGRFLEKTVETGLNDVDFDNALKVALNPTLTKDNLQVSEKEFEKIKANALLLSESINPLKTTYAGFTESNQEKALNAIIKGTRVGFKYDKKTSTESDPMFAYNLKKQEDMAKVAAKRAEQAAMIGSDYFLTPNETKVAYRNTFTNTLGENKGELTEYYKEFFKDGKLITKEEVEKRASKLKESTPMWNTTSSSNAPSFTPTLGYGAAQYKADYDELVKAFTDLDLDPATTTKEKFLNALHTDVQGRRRASITSNDSGFKVIQSNIEAGLRNQEGIQEVKGLKKGDDGVSRYRTETINPKELYDDKGNLNILRINMDYATGERTFMIKTPKGDVREFIIPDSASYEAEDPRTLSEITANIREAEQGYTTGYVKKDGKLIEVRVPLTPKEQATKLEELYTNADLMFGSIFNIFGANTVN